MNLRICPICGGEFVANSFNQKYDKTRCKIKAERQRRRSRETPEAPAALSDGLFATLENPTLENLQSLRNAYVLTRSRQPSRIIGPLPYGWGEVIHLDTIVPEYGTENHMYLPQE